MIALGSLMDESGGSMQGIAASVGHTLKQVTYFWLFWCFAKLPAALPPTTDGSPARVCSVSFRGFDPLNNQPCEACEDARLSVPKAMPRGSGYVTPASAAAGEAVILTNTRRSSPRVPWHFGGVCNWKRRSQNQMCASHCKITPLYFYFFKVAGQMIFVSWR